MSSGGSSWQSFAAADTIRKDVRSAFSMFRGRLENHAGQVRNLSYGKCMTQTLNVSAAHAKAAPPPTPQQQAAIDTKHVSVVLSAGAGCGKTSVLTQRFLSHLEPGHDAADLSSLVAITFTERAAREMRTRIREQCVARLRACPPPEANHWLPIVRAL